MGLGDVFCLAQPVVVLGEALEGGEQREPGQGRGRERARPDAPGERQGLVGTAADGRPLAGDEMTEAQALQRIDHAHDRPGLAGPRQPERVEVLLRRVVTELERGVAEVPEDVEVGHRVSGPEGDVERCDGAGPVRPGHPGHREQHLGQAHGAG